MTLATDIGNSVSQYIGQSSIYQNGVTYAGQVFGTINNTTSNISGAFGSFQNAAYSAQHGLDLLKRANPFNQAQAQSTMNYQNPVALQGNEAQGAIEGAIQNGLNSILPGANVGGAMGSLNPSHPQQQDWLASFGQRALFFVLGAALIVVGVVFIAAPAAPAIQTERLKSLQIGALKAARRKPKAPKEPNPEPAPKDDLSRPPVDFFKERDDLAPKRAERKAKSSSGFRSIKGSGGEGIR